MEKYYRILKIRRGATQIEIRNAYRKLAKKLHPDVNNSPTAKEDFIELNEAYEFLTDPEVRRKVRYKATPKARKTTRTTQHHQWNKEKREKAREKAKAYAKQRREDYLKRKALELRKNAPRFILMYSLIYCVLVGYPVLLSITVSSDNSNGSFNLSESGVLVFILAWILPVSFLIFRGIWKEIKLLKKK